MILRVNWNILKLFHMFLHLSFICLFSRETHCFIWADSLAEHTDFKIMTKVTTNTRLVLFSVIIFLSPNAIIKLWGQISWKWQGWCVWTIFFLLLYDNQRFVEKKNILLERTKSANHNFRSDHIWTAKLTLTLTELKWIHILLNLLSIHISIYTLCLS